MGRRRGPSRYESPLAAGKKVRATQIIGTSVVSGDYIQYVIFLGCFVSLCERIFQG